MGSDCLMETELLFCKIEKVLWKDGGMVAQGECT
jgi:hypothetical protein